LSFVIIISVYITLHGAVKGGNRWSQQRSGRHTASCRADQKVRLSEIF